MSKSEKSILGTSSTPKFIHRTSLINSLPLELVYITLPYKNIESLVWTKSVNNFKLSITSGINEETKEPYGIPFGTFARRLLYFTCTEAVKKNTQTILLGNSYSDAFTILCISKNHPGGKIITVLKSRFRLFFSRISLWSNKKIIITNMILNKL